MMTSYPGQQFINQQDICFELVFEYFVMKYVELLKQISKFQMKSQIQIWVLCYEICRITKANQQISNKKSNSLIYIIIYCQ